MRFLIGFILCLSVAVAGQGEKVTFKKTPVGKVDQVSPVTRSEAAAVFARTRKAIVEARVAQIAIKSAIPTGNQLATREEVILEMARIMEAAKKSMKFLPAPVKHDPKLFKVGSGAARTALAKLVAGGYVAPVGALATSSKPGLTLTQFGDAIGFFLARISDVTHMPSPKWSPYLQSGG